MPVPPPFPGKPQGPGQSDQHLQQTPMQSQNQHPAWQPYTQVIIQQPKKKNIFLRILSWIAASAGILVLSIFVLALFMGGAQQNTEPAEPGTYALGQSAEADGVIYTVSNYTYEAYLTGNTEDKAFEFYVTMENNSGSEVDYNAVFLIELVNPDGESVRALPAFQKNFFGSGTLRSGKTHAGYIAFYVDEIPGTYELNIYKDILERRPLLTYTFTVNG